jgi:GGDEF domain-containing protein
VDTVARFGGDEFVVLLTELSPDCNEATAQTRAIAEKIRSALFDRYELTEKHTASPDNQVLQRCTASIGVAMHSAKEGGRNAISFAGNQKTSHSRHR